MSAYHASGPSPAASDPHAHSPGSPARHAYSHSVSVGSRAVYRPPSRIVTHRQKSEQSSRPRFPTGCSSVIGCSPACRHVGPGSMTQWPSGLSRKPTPPGRSAVVWYGGVWAATNCLNSPTVVSVVAR